MSIRFAGGILFLLFVVGACSDVGKVDEAAVRSEVTAVLTATEAAWNEGDIEEYMEGYEQSDSLRFAGNGTVSYGWRPVLQRYKEAYPDKTAMGHLTFSDVDVDVISHDAVVVFGRWALRREQGDRSGLYTLLMRKSERGWRIVHDHSSSPPSD
ncbi:MAG: nuclear transport factor 2 family protein [Candidatus Latescibacterota bacterium]